MRTQFTALIVLTSLFCSGPALAGPPEAELVLDGLEQGFMGSSWGDSVLTVKARYSIGGDFILASQWDGPMQAGEVGVVADEISWQGLPAERAFIFSAVGLSRVHLRFDSQQVLDRLETAATHQHGAPQVYGDRSQADGALKLHWHAARIELVRQPVPDGAFVALVISAPVRMSSEFEASRAQYQENIEQRSAGLQQARNLRDGGGVLLAIGLVSMIGGGVLLGVGLDRLTGSLGQGPDPFLYGGVGALSAGANLFSIGIVLNEVSRAKLKKMRASQEPRSRQVARLRILSECRLTLAATLPYRGEPGPARTAAATTLACRW